MVWCQYNPKYNAKAKEEWERTRKWNFDSSHDVSNVMQDGTRRKVAHFKHADDAAMVENLINAFRAGTLYIGENDPSDVYLVWSNQHNAWWRSNSQGYTVYLESAGRYTREEALDICRNARNGMDTMQAPSEIPVRACDVEACIDPERDQKPELVG